MPESQPTEAEKSFSIAASGAKVIGSVLGKIEEERAIARALGKNILHSELGLLEDGELPNYQLDKSTSDRLLAHSRQDIVMCYSLLSDLQSLAHKNARNVSHTKRLLVLILLMNTLALFFFLIR
ncbi:hypothetical protein [Celeribacter sp.]|uniref:hypothetical protein n=1 Tax=Celeribacter sp. TaxID=1890673 RepID=UPI003A93AE0E